MLATGATLLATQRLAAEAADAEAAWGRAESAVVTTTAIAAGDAIGVDNTTTIDLPLAALPDQHLTEITPGTVAAVSLAAGEIVHPSRLVGAADPLASRVAAAVPVGDLSGLVNIGDLIDVWVAVDPFVAEPGDAPSRRLVAAAAVLDLTDTTALLAIGPDEVAELSAALPYGVVTLTIVGRAPG